MFARAAPMLRLTNTKLVVVDLTTCTTPSSRSTADGTTVDDSSHTAVSPEDRSAMLAA